MIAYLFGDVSTTLHGCQGIDGDESADFLLDHALWSFLLRSRLPICEVQNQAERVETVVGSILGVDRREGVSATYSLRRAITQTNGVGWSESEVNDQSNLVELAGGA